MIENNGKTKGRPLPYIGTQQAGNPDIVIFKWKSHYLETSTHNYNKLMLLIE